MVTWCVISIAVDGLRRGNRIRSQLRRVSYHAVQFFRRPKKNKPPIMSDRGFGYKAPGSDLLLHGLSHTTIGAGAFHFRVRNGIGWYHAAISAREAVEFPVAVMRLRTA